MQSRKLTGLIVAMHCALGCTATAIVGSAHAAEARTSLEEVVVTARKREEAVQSVPLAISALTGDMLSRGNVTDVSSLSTKVPSLMASPGAGANKATPTFAIRGQSQQELTILSDPSVTVYFGDLVAARPQGLNQAVYDLQSVEVLKGPQGTLFGRNVTGGAITMRPNLPSNQFEGYVQGTIGSYNRRNTEAMVNLPLNDVVQFRISGKTTRADGYLKDVVLDKDVNNENTKSLRLQMRVAPTDGFESTTIYNRFLERDGGTGSTLNLISTNTALPGYSAAAALGYTGANSLPALYAQQKALGIYKTASGADQFAHVATWDAANTTTWEVNDAVSFKNIIGYRKIASHTSDDVDGMPIPVLQIQRDDTFSQFSEEFQVFGSTDSLEWIAGLYFFHEQGRNFDPSVTLASANGAAGMSRPQPIATGFPNWGVTDVAGNNTSKSVFGQTTYNLGSIGLDKLSATVGLRYTWDEKEVKVRNNKNGGTTCSFSLDTDNDPATPEVVPPIGGCVFKDSAKYGQSTYNLSLDYQLTPDVLMYLAHRKGYRSGGFGARATTQAGLERTFSPEVVKDIEFGTKADWHFDNGMSARTNLAIYKSKYSDIQRLLQDPTAIPITTVAVNAGKAEIDGAELELTFLPIQSLELSGFYSYTHAKFVKFDAPDGSDLSHQPFARAPQNVYSLTARYTLPLDPAIGDVSMQANYWHTSGYSASDSYDPTVMMPGYGLWNLRADWKSVFGSNFDTSLYVNNAANKKYEFATILLVNSIGFNSHTPGEPRTVGLELKYRFGALGN